MGNTCVNTRAGAGAGGLLLAEPPPPPTGKIAWIAAEEGLAMRDEERLFREYIENEIQKLTTHIPKGMQDDNAVGIGAKGGPDLHFGHTFAVAAATLVLDEAKLARLPDELRVGLFAKPQRRRHPAFVRFNYGTGATCRMSVKIFVGGDPDKEVNWTSVESFPSFVARDVKELSLLSNDQKRLLSPLHWNMLPTLAKASKRLGSTHRLHESSAFGRVYYSQLPYALGPSAMKYRFAPESSGGLEQVTATSAEAKAKLPGRRDPQTIADIADDLRDHLGARGRGGRFAFAIQVHSDKRKHPLEDGRALWDEHLQPYADMGTLEIHPWWGRGQQDHGGDEQKEELKEEAKRGAAAAGRSHDEDDVGDDEEDREHRFHFSPFEAIQDKMTFHPWDTIDEHRPLGHLQRGRKIFYAAYGKARLSHLFDLDGPLPCPFLKKGKGGNKGN